MTENEDRLKKFHDFIYKLDKIDEKIYEWIKEDAR